MDDLFSTAFFPLVILFCRATCEQGVYLEVSGWGRGVLVFTIFYTSDLHIGKGKSGKWWKGTKTNVWVGGTSWLFSRDSKTMQSFVAKSGSSSGNKCLYLLIWC